MHAPIEYAEWASVSEISASLDPATGGTRRPSRGFGGECESLVGPEIHLGPRCPPPQPPPAARAGPEKNSRPRGPAGVPLARTCLADAPRLIRELWGRPGAQETGRTGKRGIQQHHGSDLNLQAPSRGRGGAGRGAGAGPESGNPRRFPMGFCLANGFCRTSHKKKLSGRGAHEMAGLSVRARGSGAEGDGAGEPSTSRPAAGGRAAGRAGPSAGGRAARRGGAPGGDTRGVTGAPSRPGAGGSPAKRLRVASGGAGGAPWVAPGGGAPAAPGALGKQDSFVVSGSAEARTVTTTPQGRGPGLRGGSEALTAARPTPAGPAPRPAGRSPAPAPPPLPREGVSRRGRLPLDDGSPPVPKGPARAFTFTKDLPADTDVPPLPPPFYF